MVRRSTEDEIDFKVAFTAGAKFLIREKKLVQVHVAKRSGIKPSYLCDILSERKYGTEETRKAIAYAIGIDYRNIINIGYNILDKDGNELVKQACKRFTPFTEDRAACIYRIAAEQFGIGDSFSFSSDSLKKLSPPGWADYMHADMSDSQLYKIALHEMKDIKKGMEQKQKLDVP